MKKLDKITKQVEADKTIMKYMRSNEYYSIESFIRDANAYIKAIKENRMICNILSVSKSGMSRNICFLSCEKGTIQYNYRTYWALFKSLGFSPSRSDRDYFNISGCGMDMIFHTNYCIIHDLYNLGFINKDQCASLAQKTPTII